jgi:crossover junction endodeoxyribonuclease RuvC
MTKTLSGIKHTPIILGIDPGYDRVGWAIGSYKSGDFITLGLGCIQTDKNNSIFTRYQQIQIELEEVIKKFNPESLAIEALFFAKNKKTAMRVSEARGTIISTCLRYNLNVFEYRPIEIKLAVTGDGRASKDAVEKMVRLQSNLKENDHLDDAIDAVAIMMTHAVTARN